MAGGVLTELLYSIDWSRVTIGVVLTLLSAAGLWARKRIPGWISFWRNVLDGLSTLPDLRQDVKGIRYYVAPNGGGSMMDSLKRTEAAVGQLGEQLLLLTQTVLAENDSEDDVGRFHTSATGENVYVSQHYARMLGVGKTELLGWQFLNFIHPDDVDRVRRYWELCRTEHRPYRATYRMVNAEQEVFEVETSITPVPEVAPAKRWVGVIRRVRH